METKFDVIVIGGGAAGLGCAGALGHLGARVCLVEKHELGGECLHTGCVPSKALLAAAKARHAVRRQAVFGLASLESPPVDLGAVMDRVRSVVDTIQAHETPEVMQREFVERVVFGPARFVDPHTVEVEGERLTARKFVVCTGSRPAVPPIEGLDSVGFLTNETVFDLRHLPPRLAVLGAGPIGCEMAQAFARLGSKVLVIDLLDRILGNDDTELALALQRSLKSEGVEFRLSSKVASVGPAQGGIRITVATAQGAEERVVEQLLVATGRRPSIEGLALENAGVRVGPGGIEVDKRLRTSQPHIWALGDINGRTPFSHMAEAQVRSVAANIAFGLPSSFEPARAAWATFTDPELASVGLTEDAAQEQGRRVRVLRWDAGHVDRALADGSGHGSVKVVCTPRSGRVLGAQILAPGAGDLLQEWILAVHHKLRIWQISNAIHVYPTWSLLSQRAADGYLKAWTQRPDVHAWMRRLYRWFG